jgi:translocation and assembly module TamA
MRSPFRAPFLGAACLLAAAAPAFAKKAPRDGRKDLCPSVRLFGPELELTEVEKRLVCGHPGSEGWRDIPPTQAEGFLRAFLQRRGFHYPRFQAVDEALEVTVGTRTLITKLTGRGLEGLYDLGKKRGVVGKPLTPLALDRLKGEVTTRLQEKGFGCPTVIVDADARTGVIQVTAKPGIRHLLTYIHAPPVTGIDPGVFERFRAHQYGYPLDIRTLNLTSERIMQETLFQSAFYELNCSTSGLSITQRIVEDKPRLVTVAFGVDTEGYARTRAQWRHSRIGYRASSALVALFASYREQEFNALMHYYLRPSDRINLEPSYTARRANEFQFETVEQQLSLAPNWTWDNDFLHLDARGGPVLGYYNTLRGLGPVNDTFFSFNTRTTIMSHLFEYYQRDPREGWFAGFESSSRDPAAYSRLKAHRLRVYGEALWDVGRYDPPLFVVANRGWAGTIASNSSEAFTQLPPTQRFYLGGDADFRGSRRQSLPTDSQGFLSALYDGVELRFNGLPYRLQPLLLADMAMGGRRAFHLDRDIYYSPGAGIRWASPFGAVRLTLARGMVARPSSENPTTLPRWQFFATFGTEF